MTIAEASAEDLIRDAELVDITGLPSTNAHGDPCVIAADRTWYGSYFIEHGNVFVVTWQGRVLWARAKKDWEAQKCAILRLTSRLLPLSVPIAGINPQHLAARRRNPYYKVS